MLFSSQKRRAKVLFILIDGALLLLAFEAAYESRQALRFLPHEFFFTSRNREVLTVFSVLAWALAGHWADGYSGILFGSAVQILRNAFRQAVLGTVALVLFEFALRLDVSRPFIVLFSIYGWMLLSGYRLLLRRWPGAFREFGRQHCVVVVGTGQRALQLGEQLTATAEHGNQLHGFVALDENPSPASPGRALAAVFPRSELRLLLQKRVIDEVVFAVDPCDMRAAEELFRLCGEEGVRTRLAVDFVPHPNSGVRLEFLGPTPLLTFNASPDDPWKLFAKRAMDIVVSASSLILLSPVMLLTAILIKLTSPGPAIFRQERCGLNGRRFTCYKFRSMVIDAERRKAEVLHMSRRQTATKIPHDPRLSPIGGLLRKFSIDELPQLFNVLRGDMSLVGPRPAVPSEVALYSQWQRRRMRVRPGLTCLWALNGRDAVDFETWMKLDLFYIDHWSLLLDCQILVKTIPVVALGRGAS